MLCVAVGQPVSLTAVYSGAYSYDPDNGYPYYPGKGITEYDSDMGDGAYLGGSSIVHEYLEPAEHEVQLTVWDDEQWPFRSFAKDLITVWVVAIDVYAGLSEEQEGNPGLYVNVNWGDDDLDGWTPNDNPPNGIYKGDKDDEEITGGDNDFRLFSIAVNPGWAPVGVVIEFENNIKVWETWTKKKWGEGEEWISSQVPSGSQFNLQEGIPYPLLIEGQSGTQNFRDVSLRATVKYGQNQICSDTVKITVFEVSLTGLFAGAQQADCDKKHSTFTASSDRNGKISWDDADGDGVAEGAGDYDTNCLYFHDCMECQGTVKPGGVTTAEAEFTFERDVWGRVWGKLPGEGFWSLAEADVPWQDDGWPDDRDEDNSPSAQNHIYHIDGPGCTSKDQASFTHWSAIADWRECVWVNLGGEWYQCSNFYKWHSQIYVKPKNATELTRDAPALQNLGGGWINVPTNP